MTTFNDPRLGASIDNPSLADRVINLSKELSEANDKIGLLTLAKNDVDQALESATSRAAMWQRSHGTLYNRIDAASETIKSAIIANDIDKDTLVQIASNLNVELTREVRVKMRITASGTATVPIDFDLDDLDGEIGIEFSNNYGNDVEFDFEVDDMSLDCEDI